MERNWGSSKSVRIGRRASISLAGVVASALAVGCSGADAGLAEEGFGDESVATSAEAMGTIGTGSWFQDSQLNAATMGGAAGVMDQFVVHTDGTIGHWFLRPGSGWQFVAISAPPSGARAIAVSRTASRAHLVVLANNGKVYSDLTRLDGFIDPWVEVPNAPLASSTSKVTVAARTTASGAFRSDVFWISTANRIVHAQFSATGVTLVETGSSTSKSWFNMIGTNRPNGEIRAVSSGPNRLDVFYLAGPPHLFHIWQDGSSWGSFAAPNREEVRCSSDDVLDGEFLPFTMTAVSSLPGLIDVIVRMGPDGGVPTNREMRKTVFNGSWSKRDGVVMFDQLTITPTNIFLPPKLWDANLWTDANGTRRIQLWGGNANDADQFEASFVE
jgi:hypothetical protein